MSTPEPDPIRELLAFMVARELKWVCRCGAPATLESETACEPPVCDKCSRTERLSRFSDWRDLPSARAIRRLLGISKGQEPVEPKPRYPWQPIDPAFGIIDRAPKLLFETLHGFKSVVAPPGETFWMETTFADLGKPLDLLIGHTSAHKLLLMDVMVGRESLLSAGNIPARVFCAARKERPKLPFETVQAGMVVKLQFKSLAKKPFAVECWMKVSKVKW